MSPDSPVSEESVLRTAPSIARNSLASLLANVATLGFALITGAITARLLGPAGKGALAALLFIGEGVLFYVCRLGLGDALLVIVGRRDASFQAALSAALLPLFFSSLAGAAILFGVSFLADWEGILPSVLIEGLALFAWMIFDLCASVLNAREDFVTTAWARSVVGALIAVGTAIFVVILKMGLLGAVLASGLAVMIGALVLVVKVGRSGLSLRPRWMPRVLSQMLHLGIGVQMSYLLIAMSQRLDQLIVYAIIGETAGGNYAVAITVAGIALVPPYALSAAAFPRIAQADEKDFLVLTAQVTRVGLLAGIATAIPLYVLTPFALPLVFGAPYEAAVTPALILIASSIVWSTQWILARAVTARGMPGLKFRSFAVNVLLMLVLDVILIPRFGLVGAGIASLTGAGGGLVVCAWDFARQSRGLISFREFVPSVSDLRVLFDFARSLVASPRASAPHEPSSLVD